MFSGRLLLMGFFRTLAALLLHCRFLDTEDLRRSCIVVMNLVARFVAAFRQPALIMLIFTTVAHLGEREGGGGPGACFELRRLFHLLLQLRFGGYR